MNIIKNSLFAFVAYGSFASAAAKYPLCPLCRRNNASRKNKKNTAGVGLLEIKMHTHSRGMLMTGYIAHTRLRFQLNAFRNGRAHP